LKSAHTTFDWKLILSLSLSLSTISLVSSNLSTFELWKTALQQEISRKAHVSIKILFWFFFLAKGLLETPIKQETRNGGNFGADNFDT